MVSDETELIRKDAYVFDFPFDAGVDYPSQKSNMDRWIKWRWTPQLRVFTAWRQKVKSSNEVMRKRWWRNKSGLVRR